MQRRRMFTFQKYWVCNLLLSTLLPNKLVSTHFITRLETVVSIWMGAHQESRELCQVCCKPHTGSVILKTSFTWSHKGPEVLILIFYSFQRTFVLKEIFPTSIICNLYKWMKFQKLPNCIRVVVFIFFNFATLERYLIINLKITRTHVLYLIIGVFALRLQLHYSLPFYVQCCWHGLHIAQETEILYNFR